MTHIKKTLAGKISLITVTVIVICSVGIGVVSFLLYREHTIMGSAKQAQSAAQAAADSINAEQLSESIATGTKTEYWQHVQDSFNKLIVNIGAEYLYALEKDYDSDITYIVVGLKPGDESYGDLGTRESTSVFSEEMRKTLDTGVGQVTKAYVSEGYGTLVSGYAPIVDQNGKMIGLVGVDLGINDVTRNADNFGIIMLLVVLGFCVLFGVLCFCYYNKAIGNPLTFLSSFMKKAGLTGNIALQPEDMASINKYSRIKDEIGQTIRNSAAFIAHVTHISETLEHLSNGDLTTELEILSDVDTMGKSFQLMTDKFNDMFSRINSSATQVFAASRQIADGSQTLAQGSTEQAASVEQLLASISEMSEKTKNNAEMAGKAAELGDNIIRNAEKGSAQMSEMMSAVKDINAAGQSIGKVIKVINDIAFQTNILALNAAVEAARAGQHGKGFAIVADEVRNLASKSAEAAKDTSDLIADSIEKAKLGARIAGETSASLSEIVQGINESSRLVSQIAQSCGEQSSGITQINVGIDQVARVIQQNSAMAEVSAASSDKMSGQSAILQELIAQFNLNLKADGS